MNEETFARKTWVVRLNEMIHPHVAVPPTLLAASGGLMAIAAVYLYFAGYLYSYFFFRTFGVTLESLDLSSQFFFVRAFLVFGTVRGFLIACALMLLAGGYAAGRIRLTILLAGLLAAFPAIYGLSWPVARHHAQSLRKNPESSISLRFKKTASAEKTPADTRTGQVKTETVPDKAAAPPSATAKEKKAPFDCSLNVPAQTVDELVTLGDGGCLYTLLETKDRIVMYFQPAGNPNFPKDIPAVTVYTVMRSDLEMSVVTSN